MGNILIDIFKSEFSELSTTRMLVRSIDIKLIGFPP